MGATFTSAAVTMNHVYLLQIGDSRGYVIRGDQITQITKDQSLVQQLIDSNQISPEEAERHALKNVILQALGAQSEIFPVGGRFEPRRDDILLLCSDGLSNKLPDADLLSYVKQYSNDLATGCQELVREANARGGEDNITVILAKFIGDEFSKSATEEIIIEPLSFHNSTDKDLMMELS
jgi:protein phosphatase